MIKILFNLIEIQPIEINQSKLCIWCDLPNRKNDAHIISRQLLKTNLKKNILKHTVCEQCNAHFGKYIEDWFLKYSPIGSWKQQFFQTKSTYIKNLKFLPNFIWNEHFSEWIIVNHDNVPDIIGSQVILGSNDKLLYMHLNFEDDDKIISMEKIKSKFKLALKNNEYSEYVEKKLPENFRPRLFLYKGKVIIVSKTSEDIIRIKSKLENSSNEFKNQNDFLSFGNINYNSLIIHYKWSYSKYFKWASKIAFEFLALIENPEFIRNSAFNNLKSNMINPRTYRNDDVHNIPYVSGKGYEIGRFLPLGWVSMFFDAKKYNLDLPTFETANTTSHKIFIYELNGLLLCTIKIFDLELCQVILAENVNLESIYYVQYDYLNDQLKFYQTARKVFNKEFKQPTFDEALNIFDKETMIHGTVTLNEEIRKLFI